MTTTAEPLLPPQRTTGFDRFRSRVAGDPARLRLYGWLVPTVITLVAAVLRLFNLGHPHELVFDETYYVKDSWSQWAKGFPSTWPDAADERFIAGETDIFTSTGSFVVHPPLGRFLIGAGMALFGADSSFGWRFAVAVFGTATVLVLFFLARALTGSFAFAGVASGLLAIDGVSIVLSRVALLDTFLTFFLVLGFLFVVLDRRSSLDRLAALVAARGHAARRWGPVLWNRPWLFAAGAALGAATAVKWSGLYALAGVGVYVVVTDALARRRAGVALWPTAAAFAQGPASFLLLVPVAALVYLVSWTGWLVTTGGYGRGAEPATGLLGWVPRPLQALWNYHEAIYGFHVGLSTPHSYESPAWQWPLLLRPTSMYWHQDAAGENGCALPAGCTEAISSLANPLLWWAGVAAALYLVVRFVLTRDWRLALVLTAIAVTYVPWLLYPERTIFQFYTVAIAPFLVLALALVLRDLAGQAGDPAARRIIGQRAVTVFLLLVGLVSAFWYPVWSATPVPYEFWHAHNWLPTWI